MSSRLLISIHALLAESDRAPSNTPTASRNFYPRSPCGARPTKKVSSTRLYVFLSTLSLRRATVHYDNYNLHCVISIHALLAESDCVIDIINNIVNDFYPRSPCGERLIHPRSCNAKSNFYPRSPCGERPCTTTITISIALFLSTLSLRRATAFLPADRMSHQEFLSTLSLRRATLTISRNCAKSP